MASGPISSWQMGKKWKQWHTLFFGAPKSLQMVTAAMKLKDTPWKESYDQPRYHIEKQRHYFANKGPSSQGYGFSNGHVWISLESKGLSSLLQHHSSKASILQRSAFFTVQISHPYMTTGKTIVLTRRTFVGKVMSLLFSMLSRLVITFLPRSVF